jgi:hypothetical protein
MYWREYRTEFHIGLAYGISESTVCRTIKKIENTLIKSEQFHLKIHPHSQTTVKKTKLHLLDTEQKASNRELSRKRIVIEHIFCKLKVFRILRERYRNRRKRFVLRFSLIAAVYNMERTN